MAEKKAGKAQGKRKPAKNATKGKAAAEKPDEGQRGQPPLFKTAVALQAKIDAYFEACKPEPLYYDDVDGVRRIATNKDGKPIIIENPATMAGLAYFLGFVSRQSLYDTEKRGEDFSYAIKRSRLRIEAQHEANLSTRDKPTGDIFWLKNHDWSDKQEIDHRLIEPPRLELVLQGAKS